MPKHRHPPSSSTSLAMAYTLKHTRQTHSRSRQQVQQYIFSYCNGYSSWSHAASMVYHMPLSGHQTTSYVTNLYFTKSGHLAYCGVVENFPDLREESGLDIS